MLHITVWTNDPTIPQPIKDAVKAVLDAGQAVYIGASCIGHTRAQMVESAGSKYLKDEFRIHPVAREEHEWHTHVARKPKLDEHMYLVTWDTVQNKHGVHWKTVVYGKTLKDARERFKAAWTIHEFGQRPCPRHPFHIDAKRL